jgi:hypothetical protein
VAEELLVHGEFMIRGGRTVGSQGICFLYAWVDGRTIGSHGPWRNNCWFTGKFTICEGRLKNYWFTGKFTIRDGRTIGSQGICFLYAWVDRRTIGSHGPWRKNCWFTGKFTIREGRLKNCWFIGKFTIRDGRTIGSQGICFLYAWLSTMTTTTRHGEASDLKEKLLN